MTEKYRFIKQIGEGTFGTVDLVQDEMGNKFALKSTFINPFQAQKNQKQILCLAKLDHPNLVKVIQNFCSSDKCQILLEYCDQGDLKNKLTNFGCFPDDILYQYFRQIVDAGVQMHNQGIVHRDLKPSNILLKSQSNIVRLKIADFGQAKVCPVLEKPFKIEQSFDRGTPDYASPQLLTNELYSFKCDIWSLGCIFYECCVGTHPFSCPTVSETVDKIKNLTDGKELILPNNLENNKKQFMKICLQYRERDRGSWRELKLSRVLEEKVGCQEWMEYLRNLIQITKKINKQFWNKHKLFSSSKTASQGFSYFLTKFQVCALKMLVDVSKGSQQYSYLCTSPNQIDNTQIQKLNEEYQNSYSAICALQRNLRDKCDHKFYLEELPEKRNPIFACLDHSIQIVRFIVLEAFQLYPTMEQIQKEQILQVLIMWANFTEVFMFENTPKIQQINNPKLSGKLFDWVKSQLKQNK